MHQMSEPITLLIGDQSLSEGITMQKPFLYDPRKIDSLEWMIRLAKRNNLLVIAEYLDAFTYKKNPTQVVEILQNPKLMEEKKEFISICSERNLYRKKLKNRQNLTCPQAYKIF